MNQTVNNIKQRLSLREPLAEALEVVAKLTDKLALKKAAAEEYCRHASEFTAENGGKPWIYILLPHDIIDRTVSFEYLIATHN